MQKSLSFISSGFFKVQFINLVDNLQRASFGSLFHLLVGVDGYLHAAVSLAAFGRGVVSNGVSRAEAFSRNTAACYFLCRQAISYGLGTALAQRLVDGIGAGVIGVAFY